MVHLLVVVGHRQSVLGRTLISTTLLPPLSHRLCGRGAASCHLLKLATCITLVSASRLAIHGWTHVEAAGNGGDEAVNQAVVVPRSPTPAGVDVQR